MCVFCRSVSDVRSSQVRYCHPALPRPSDTFEHYQHPSTGLGYIDGDDRTRRFEYSEYDASEERSHKWTCPVIGWQRTTQRGDWLQVADLGSGCGSSYSACNCCDGYDSDDHCTSSVKRRAQFYGELSAAQCCSVILGSAPCGLWGSKNRAHSVS